MEKTVWYTNAFLTTALSAYLRRRGYVARVKETAYGDKTERVLLASKWGSRRIIEIKGEADRGSGAERRELLENAFGDGPSNWFQSNLFNSLLSLARSYKDGHLPVALCLPDTDRHREILTGVQQYFTENNLHLEVYLVRQDGVVNTLNLNQADGVASRKKQPVTSK